MPTKTTIPNRPALMRAMVHATWNEAKANDLTFDELLVVTIELQRQIAAHSEIELPKLIERISMRLSPPQTLDPKP